MSEFVVWSSPCFPATTDFYLTYKTAYRHLRGRRRSFLRLVVEVCQAKSVGLLLLVIFVILAGKGPVSGGVLRSGAARQGIQSLGLQPAPAPSQGVRRLRVLLYLNALVFQAVE